jgi:hypothetical protein
MSGSQREDYVLRQVRAIAAMLARISGLRIGGEADQARKELEDAYALLLGSQGELIRRVDTATAAILLGSPERVRSFADLLEEEALEVEDGGRAAFLRERASELRRALEHGHPG